MIFISDFKDNVYSIETSETNRRNIKQGLLSSPLMRAKENNHDRKPPQTLLSKQKAIPRTIIRPNESPHRTTS